MAPKDHSTSRAIRTASFLLGGDAPAYRQVWDAVKKRVVTIHRDELDGRDPCCGLCSCEAPSRHNHEASSAAEPVDSKPLYRSNTISHTAELEPTWPAASEDPSSPTTSADSALKLLRRLQTNPELGSQSVRQPVSPRRRFVSEAPVAAAVTATVSISPFNAPGAVESPRTRHHSPAVDHSSPFAAVSRSKRFFFHYGSTACNSSSPKAVSPQGFQHGASPTKAVSFAADVTPTCEQPYSTHIAHQPIERAKSTGHTLEATFGTKAVSSSPTQQQVPRSKSTGQLFKNNRLPPLGASDSSLPGGRPHISSNTTKGLATERNQAPVNGSGESFGPDEYDLFAAYPPDGLSSPTMSPKHKEHGVRWGDNEHDRWSEGLGSSSGGSSSKRSSKPTSSRSSFTAPQHAASGFSSLPGTLLASAVAAVHRWKTADSRAAAKCARSNSSTSGTALKHGHVPQQDGPAIHPLQRQHSSPLHEPPVHLPPITHRGDTGNARSQPAGVPATMNRLERSRSGSCAAGYTGSRESTVAPDNQYRPHHVAVDKLDQKVLSRARSEKDSTRYDRVIAGL